MAQEFLIALGSNLGSTLGAGPDRQTLGPAATLAAALQAMNAHGVTLRRVSRFFATPCFPAGAGPDYVNACAVVTDHASVSSPMDFLYKLHEIEREFGRERAQRWGSRTLDLDLIAAGDAVLPDLATWGRWHDLPPDEQTRRTPDQLILPHPRLQDRAFVLVPLADIAASWEHPVLRRNVATLCADLPSALRDEVVALSGT